MIIVGLTGGIGSGKTVVANYFAELGIPIYISDNEAKKLMVTSKVIREELKALLGENTYIGDEINKAFIADKIFNDKNYLKQINAIVHPRVNTHFNTWVTKQKSPYVIKETAILFENGSHESCDYIITVTAPKHLRIKRVLERDNTSTKRIEAIMKNQWEDKKKIQFSDFNIENIYLQSTKNQVLVIHDKIVGYPKVM